jgi:hypothetical protein
MLGAYSILPRHLVTGWRGVFMPGIDGGAAIFVVNHFKNVVLLLNLYPYYNERF